METATVQEKLEQGAQILNVLEPKFYQTGSIQGSIRIPVSELEGRLSELNKDREVIVYCLGGACTASRQGAEILRDHGFEVSVYEGGITEWRAAGLPLDGEEDDTERQIAREINEGGPVAKAPGLTRRRLKDLQPKKETA